ncbi:peroxidase 47 [Typha latifolia]|uniref:peroxidase 47 n=1 Tax=Typha latifolia TaxID=4733 RepID=UPI003C2EB7D4
MSKMNTAYVVLLLLIEVLMRGARLGVDALSVNYYGMACPFVEPIVRNVVNQALQKDPTLAAALLRLHFHDCFVQGCDASVLIDSTNDNTAEKDSPANQSLRGYEVIDQAKQIIEMQCPGVVSCADIVALAARDAVIWAGGPYYDILKGRRDGTRSKIQDTVNLPAPTLNSTALIQMFVGQHGFTVQELVALSGGHTLGVARCSSFKNRLKNFDATNDVDPSLEPNFAKTLSTTCSGGDTAVQAFDSTMNTFDNAYFSALQRGWGVLTSDQTLFTSPQTKSIVNAFAMNQAMFFFIFQQGMLRMGSLDVKEGNQGEVRLNCRKIN